MVCSSYLSPSLLAKPCALVCVLVITVGCNVNDGMVAVGTVTVVNAVTTKLLQEML